MAETVDWAKAGKRLKVSPRLAGQNNPDWNAMEKRWKDLADYAADTLPIPGVLVECSCPRPGCFAPQRAPCRDVNGRPMDGPHYERRRAAGARLVSKGWML